MTDCKMNKAESLCWQIWKREHIQVVLNKERLGKLKALLKTTERAGAFELCPPIVHNIIDLEVKVLISESMMAY